MDKQQALVRKSSVVNMENFKRQYARRRWKVWQRALILLTCGFPSLMGSEGKLELECRTVLGSECMKCVWVSPLGLCGQLVLLLSAQLSYRIVSLCNRLSRSLVTKVLAQDESSVGAFLTRGEEPVLLSSPFCCPQRDVQPNRTAVAQSGKPDGAVVTFVSLLLLYDVLLWQESCAGRASDLTDLLGAKHSYCVKEQPGGCRWCLDPRQWPRGAMISQESWGAHYSCAQLCDGGWGTPALPVTWSETLRALLALLFSTDDTDYIV